MTDLKDAKEKIIHNLNFQATFPELQAIDKGKYYTFTCPNCKDSKSGFYYKNTTKLSCNHKNKCGLDESLTDYYMRTRGLNLKEAYLELSKQAGISFSFGAISPEREKARVKQASILDALHKWTIEELKNNSGALEYIKKRGYTQGEQESFQLGFYSNKEQAEKALKTQGYSKGEIESLDLHNVYNKIFIPYKDSIGRHKGYILRAINESDSVKYLYYKGIDKNLFGLSGATKEKPLVIVEGIFDSLIGQHYNLNTVSCETNQITIEQATKLKELGYDKIILALDNDNAGYKGTVRSIEVLRAQGINSLVLDYRNDFLYSDYKDLDDIIRATRDNIELLEKSFKSESVISWQKWLALDFIDKHKNTKSDLEREELLNDLALEASKIKDSFRAKEYCDTVIKGLSLPENFMESRLELITQNREKEEQEKTFDSILSRAKELQEQGKTKEAIEFIKNTESSLSSVSFSYGFKAPGLDELEHASQESFAYPLPYNTFPKKEIGFNSGAITIIAGRPSNGKTSFMLNCYLGLAQKHSGTFAFFSYEESQNTLAMDLISMLTRQILKTSQSFSSKDILEHFKTGRKDIENPIEKGVQEYKRLIDNKSLHLDYTPYRIDELVKSIYSLSNETDLKCIFVDYIQKINSDKGEKDRYLQIKRVSEKLLDVSVKLNIPIITGAQLKREGLVNPSMESLRESGDIEQDANTILAVIKQDMIESEETRAQDEAIKETTLGVKVLKNRKGGFVNSFFPLEFHNSSRLISDYSHSDNRNETLEQKLQRNKTLRETKREELLKAMKAKKKPKEQTK